MPFIRLLLLFALCIAAIAAHAQEDTSKPAHANIYVGRQFTNGMVEVKIGDQEPYALGSGSVLNYKIYSTGKVPVTALVRYTNKLITKQITLDVEKDKHYYLAIDVQGLSGTHKFLQQEKSEYQDMLKEAKAENKLLNFEEDLDYPINPGSLKKDTTLSQGSAFLVGQAGYFVTNHHVVEGANAIYLKGENDGDSMTMQARRVAIDRANDLALLKVDSSEGPFPKPPYAITQQAVKQGASIFTLGYPLENVMGSGVKVTRGIINALNGYKGSVSEYQFSASVQPGNSGGPLFNDQGDVVGVVKAKIQGRQVESVGYAIKSTQLRLFLRQVSDFEYKAGNASMSDKPFPQKVKKLSDYVYSVTAE